MSISCCGEVPDENFRHSQVFRIVKAHSCSLIRLLCSQIHERFPDNKLFSFYHHLFDPDHHSVHYKEQLLKLARSVRRNRDFMFWYCDGGICWITKNNDNSHVSINVFRVTVIEWHIKQQQNLKRHRLMSRYFSPNYLIISFAISNQMFCQFWDVNLVTFC